MADWLRTDRAARLLFVVAQAREEALWLPTAGGDFTGFLRARRLPFHRVCRGYETEPMLDDQEDEATGSGPAGVPPDGPAPALPSLRERLGIAQIASAATWAEITRCGFAASPEDLLAGLPDDPSGFDVLARIGRVQAAIDRARAGRAGAVDPDDVA